MMPIAFLGAMVLQPTPQPTIEGTRFILSGWSYPDEYGQGIDRFEFYENTTGSWVQFGGYHWFNESHTHDWNYTYLKVRCWTWFNSTHVDAADTAEGQLFQRHSVVVTRYGVTVFSQQNLTYVSVDTTDDPMWWYCYEVVIDVELYAGNTYEVVVSYEIY